MKAVLLPLLLVLFLAHEGIAQRCATQGNPPVPSNLNTSPVHFRDVINLPVVVHIVWNEVEENISEEQILSQIEVLNEDFRSQNDNLDIVPEEFQNLIVDTEIVFCLTDTDPDGNSTDGITRTQTEQVNVATAIVDGARAIFYDDRGGKNAWPSDRYINIWVGRREFALGSASFPGQASPETDGIVIDPYFFGRTGLASNSQPFHLGKTLSHEMGHYLGLGHLNGPNLNSGCLMDDGIEDTPTQAGIYINECPTYPVSSCGSNDMFMNLLSLSNDECLAMFTPGQKEAMMATLANERSGLVGQNLCAPTSSDEVALNISLFEISPNPANDIVTIAFNHQEVKPGSLKLYNSAGSLLFIKKINPHTNFELDLKQFNNGLYFVSYLSNNKIQTKKLIIVK